MPSMSRRRRWFERERVPQWRLYLGRQIVPTLLGFIGFTVFVRMWERQKRKDRETIEALARDVRQLKTELPPSGNKPENAVTSAPDPVGLVLAGMALALNAVLVLLTLVLVIFAAISLTSTCLLRTQVRHGVRAEPDHGVPDSAYASHRRLPARARNAPPGRASRCGVVSGAVMLHAPRARAGCRTGWLGGRGRRTG
jgi:hypothetical protein